MRGPTSAKSSLSKTAGRSFDTRVPEPEMTKLPKTPSTSRSVRRDSSMLAMASRSSDSEELADRRRVGGRSRPESHRITVGIDDDEAPTVFEHTLHGREALDAEWGSDKLGQPASIGNDIREILAAPVIVNDGAARSESEDQLEILASKNVAANLDGRRLKFHDFPDVDGPTASLTTILAQRDHALRLTFVMNLGGPQNEALPGTRDTVFRGPLALHRLEAPLVPREHFEGCGLADKGSCVRMNERPITKVEVTHVMSGRHAHHAFDPRKALHLNEVAQSGTVDLP